MAEFEYISKSRLQYRNGYRNAYLGEVPEPVVYGVQGALREYYGAQKARPSPRPSTTSWPPSRGECTARCAAPWQGAKSSSTATATRRPSRAASSASARPSASPPFTCTMSWRCPRMPGEATERALAAHPQGCPAHQSVKDAIAITWAATLRAGEEVLTVRSEDG